MKHIKLFESFDLNESDKDHYKHIKDIDEPRPRYVPTPKPSASMMASEGSKYFNLYLQDQASDVFIDKYGYDRGLQNWNYMLDQSSGAMFAASSKIANEKLQMLRDLDILQEYGKDYFKESYFKLWKEWKEYMKDVNKFQSWKNKSVAA